MSVDPAADLTLCPNGHAVESRARFCNVCGERLPEGGGQTEAAGGIPPLPTFDPYRLRRSPRQRPTVPLAAVIILVLLALAAGIAIGLAT